MSEREKLQGELVIRQLPNFCEFCLLEHTQVLTMKIREKCFWQMEGKKKIKYTRIFCFSQNDLPLQETI